MTPIRLMLMLAALFLATPILPATAFAASDEEIYNQVDQLHGHADQLDKVLPEIRRAFGDGDSRRLATYSSFPLPVKNNGEAYDINDGADLVKYFDTLVTQQTRDAVAAMDYGDLIVNSSGVGLANGAVWLSFVCADDACKDGKWQIISINNQE
nr:hypothetical protein [uncultured Gellertiella sp.]